MAVTKLRLYNDALRHLGEARLVATTDDVEARYALDDAYASAVEFVMRQAPWRFALKVSALATSAGTALAGYSVRYSRPADWLRTHAIFIVKTGGQECPLDVREYQNVVYANATGVYMRHVTNAYVDPESAATTAAGGWPEHFAAAVAAYLAFSVAERITGDKGAAGRMSQLFSSLLPEAVQHDAVAEDPWLSHQLSGAFLRVSRALAEEDFWRFALKTSAISAASGTAEGGMTSRFAIPDDWIATRSLYRLATDTAFVQGDQRRPFDVREHAGGWHTNATSFFVEYVSVEKALDSTLWPDQYKTAVLRNLEFEAAGNGSPQGALEAAGAAWKDALASVRRSEAEPPDPWLGYQLSGAFQRCIPTVMSKGYWRFALARALRNAEVDQDPVLSDGAYPYRFSLPTDWFKTHAIFVPWDGSECPIDVREEQGYWRTATSSFMARYVSTAALDPAQWPDSVARAVRAYLDLDAAPPDAQKNAAALWGEALDAALAEWSDRPHPWLRFQLDGRYIEAVKFLLGSARWRFAIKTRVFTANATQAADGTVTGELIPNAFGDGSISPSYSAVIAKPGDWYRTIWMYRVVTSGPQVNTGNVVREDIDYRDEAGAWHTNWDTVQVRYLSRDGLDMTRAPVSFRNALLAWLEYDESRHDPKLTSVAAAKLQLFKDLQQAAEEEDDTREKPPVNQVGRFVMARYGSRWRGSSSSGGTAQTVLTDDSGTTILTP